MTNLEQNQSNTQAVEITAEVNSVTKALMELKNGISGRDAYKLAINANLDHYKNKGIDHVQIGDKVSLNNGVLRIFEETKQEKEDLKSEVFSNQITIKNNTEATRTQTENQSIFSEKRNKLRKNVEYLDFHSVSEKYESNGNSKAYGYDRVGGHSYGSFQMTKSTARKFARSIKIKGRLGSDKFLRNWRKKVDENPTIFKQQETAFIKKTHLKPQLRKLKRNGIHINLENKKVLAAIYSTAVQHGPRTNVIIKAYKSLLNNPTQEDFLRAIYTERATRFGSSTKNVQDSVKNRFRNELNTLLA